MQENQSRSHGVPSSPDSVRTPESSSTSSSSSMAFSAAALVLIAAALRLIPHPPNFTPIAGMALFGAAVFARRELGLILPLVALFLSDCVLGFHNQMVSVYISFMLIAFMGLLLRRNRSVPRLVAASLASSVLFFVITNTAVWWSSPEYPKTLQGLMLCWTVALPFFQNTVAGDLISTGALFGVWAWIQRSAPLATTSVNRSR